MTPRDVSAGGVEYSASPEPGMRHGPGGVDPRQRIYVNRNLRMDRVELIGFDMDYTLAQYKEPAMGKLAYELTAKRLVEDRGYPESLLDNEYKPDFVIRGLIVDTKLGNILKMDRYGHVVKVFHGHRPLDKEERRRSYRHEKIRASAQRYVLVDTLFSLPEICLYADLVELYDDDRAGRHPPRSYEQMYFDARQCIDAIHRDGTLKTVIRSALPTYVEQNPSLGETLHKLRSANKRLFLLTNSFAEYTNAVMSWVLGGSGRHYPSWRHFFDFVIVGAMKPRFFTAEEPFLIVDDEGQTEVDADGASFERLKIYQGGNVQDFERRVGQPGDRVLYVGDHLYGDILRSKKHSLWRTAMVIPELGPEVETSRRVRRKQELLGALDAEREDIDYAINQLRRQVTQLIRDREQAGDDAAQCASIDAQLEERRERIRSNKEELHEVLGRIQELEARVEHAFNPYWGMLFKANGEQTVFSRQVEDYACVYTSRVGNLRHYSPNQFFRSPRHMLPHERG